MTLTSATSTWLQKSASYAAPSRSRFRVESAAQNHERKRVAVIRQFLQLGTSVPSHLILYNQANL